MKLYKNTLIISTIVFVILIILSCIFEFSCISDFKVILFLNTYFIGAACSIVVVIITTFIQFKYEQRKALKSVLSDVQFFFFHYLLLIMALDPNEKTSDKQWEYYYSEAYNGVRKISSELLNIEWFSKKARKITGNLEEAVLNVMINIAKNPDKWSDILCTVNEPWLVKIKDNAILLANGEDYYAKKIAENYEKIQLELETAKLNVKTSK